MAAEPAESLAGRRVLVTGATGFIGTALCRRLDQLGAEVHGVARRPCDPDRARTWSVDLAEPEATSQLLRKVEPEVVFHLASHVSGDRALGAVLPTVRDNLLSTVNVLTAAAEVGGARVVVAGSMEEADPTEPDAVPVSPYAAAKTAARGYARMFHALYDLPVVDLQVFMVYGPGQRDGTKLVPYVISSLLRGERPALSSGTREVDWVFVDDVVAAFVAAATSETALGSAVDVGSGELVSIRSLVDRIAELVGGDAQPDFGARPDRPLERQRVADVARTRAVLGWAATTPLEAGLARTIEWFRGRGDRGDTQ